MSAKEQEDHGPSMSGGPIRPEDVASMKKKVIPEFVWAAFNELIVKNYDEHGEARVTLKEVVALIKAKLGVVDQDIDRTWLEVEAAYEENGWKVTFDKAAYNESYDSAFIFKRRSKNKMAVPSSWTQR